MKKFFTAPLMVLFLWAFSVATANANTLIGTVVAVLDGDTVKVLDNQKIEYKIRLDQIDAPEKSQAFGQKSKQYLSSLIYGKTVVVNWKKTDRYGRILGVISYNKQNINLLMVQQGYAWAYIKYLQDNKYLEAQQLAQKQKKGLWVDPNTTPPWDWRRK